jgi:hypothetical protein
MDSHYEGLIRGQAVSWIRALNQRSLRTVASTIATLARNHNVNPERLGRLLERVHVESVDPFFSPVWNQGPARTQRLLELIGELRSRGVLA